MRKKCCKNLFFQFVGVLKKCSEEFSALFPRHEDTFFFGVFDLECRIALAELLEKLQRYQEQIAVLDETDKLTAEIRKRSDEKQWLTVSHVCVFLLLGLIVGWQLHVRTRAMLTIALAGQGDERGLRVWQQMVSKDEMDQDKTVKVREEEKKKMFWLF
jgi:hypothetical protein